MKYDPRPLVRARQLKGWTRTQLAAKIGRSEAMISLVETRKRGGEKTVFLMAKVLDVPMDQVLLPERKRA